MNDPDQLYLRKLKLQRPDLNVAFLDPPSGFDASLPIVWAWAGYLFCRRTRESLWEAALNDIKSDDLKMKKYEGWARRWLTFCFAARTLNVFVRCVYVDYCPKFLRGAFEWIGKFAG